MNDCVFCKIIKGELPSYKIYEDESFLAILDINPINPGHVLLIFKEHYKSVYDLPDKLLNKSGPILKKLAISIKNGIGAEGINIIMNNENISGQMIPHAHFHIITRFTNDGYRHWLGKPYANKEEAVKIAEKIKSNF